MQCPYCKKEFTAKEAKIRSMPQSRYYFGIVVQILSDELGYSKDEVHSILKDKFLSELIYLETKKGFKEVRITRSTTELTTSDMEKYLSEIRQWASIELGFFIPEPHEEIPDEPTK